MDNEIIICRKLRFSGQRAAVSNVHQVLVRDPRISDIFIVIIIQ